MQDSEKKQEKFEVTITCEGITSTDARFTMDNIYLGDNYKPLDSYFRRADGTEIKRNYNKGERRNTNQTLPRLACQVYEKQIAALSVEDKEMFPICRYSSDEVRQGIFLNVDDYRKVYGPSLEYLTYSYDNGRQFVIYGWNIFSTLLFVQECLKRFGEPGDRFVLVYREKVEGERKKAEKEALVKKKLAEQVRVFNNPYSSVLMESKNIIFRGAPGTGKSYLAKEIAADIVSDGFFDRFEDLSAEQKEQVEFVQFHPSYDYTDFVEGLRPRINNDGSMGFELQDGIFKKFVNRARKNYEDSLKSVEVIGKEISAQQAMTDFFESEEIGTQEFELIGGNKFFIADFDEKHIRVSVPGNNIVSKVILSVERLRRTLESDEKFTKIKDIANFHNGTAWQQYSYEFALYKVIKARMTAASKVKVKKTELKNYVFIIDEINRGEISKILGELFFAIDPGYRGKAGGISTQYANLHTDSTEKFYIPENVYIIGTMNDIDRSVDSFDFAMRRRFRFIEVKADAHLDMLDSLQNENKKIEAIRRMAALNKAIVSVEDLNENYQIGASYFLKLKTLTFDELWTDCLKPLLQEYIQGMYDEAGLMSKFAKAYGYKAPEYGDADEAVQN